jgi:hypothetical protein
MTPELNHLMALAIDGNSMGRDDLRLAAEVGLLRVVNGMLFNQLSGVQKERTVFRISQQLEACIAGALERKQLNTELNTK